MEKQSSSDSNISVDSLEEGHKNKQVSQCAQSEENVTILVPFYENDVLIKVPKVHKKNKKHEVNKNERQKEMAPPNYLVNKSKNKRSNSYLEMFRKQFTPNRAEKPVEEYEISSVLPEFGDTERESIGEEETNQVTEFFESEPYNEMFYEKLLNKEISKYLDDSFDDIKLSEDTSKSLDGIEEHMNNLRSISEVTQPRRQPRRSDPVPINVNLGGLGPDMEKIKPRLDRARSLQRYSEKVRMENRLRIYKKSVADAEKKPEREISARRRESRDHSKESHNEQTISYLVNKQGHQEGENKKSKLVTKIYDCTMQGKSKSADVKKARDRTKEREKHSFDKNSSKKALKHNPKKTPKEKPEMKTMPIDNNEMVEKPITNSKLRLKSSSTKSQGINTDTVNTNTEMAPVHISFMLNVGGVPGLDNLKTLEEKHRMYQDQVKGFTLENSI